MLGDSPACYPARVAKPKDHARTQTAASLVRMVPIEREFIEEAAKRKSAELSRLVPGTTVGITQFLRQGGIRWAEEIMGTTLEAFAKKKGGGK